MAELILNDPLQIQVWFKYKIVFVVEDNWSLNRYVVSANNLFAVVDDYEKKSFFYLEFRSHWSWVKAEFSDLCMNKSAI